MASIRKAAMLQPDYIPWKGVFDLIHQVDVFVFYDDVQYTKRDWRNRNVIPTANGDLWLSVPVKTKGKQFQKICDVEINTNERWQEKHFKTLELNYRKAPYFHRYKDLLEDFYLKNYWTNLSDMDIYMTMKIADILGIKTEFVKASQFQEEGKKNGEKVIKLCKDLGCNYFINGPASKAFMDEKLFIENGVTLEYIRYDYPEYKQLVRPFHHNVSVLDLLFCTGEDAPQYIWGKCDG